MRANNTFVGLHINLNLYLRIVTLFDYTFDAAGSLCAIRVLLSHGANVDLVDVKAQTPLFVALVNQKWECAR